MVERVFTELISEIQKRVIVKSNMQEKLTQNIVHDFTHKLLQTATINALKQYVKWQRAIRSSNEHIRSPDISPISINLDLTTACNFACPHCVDLQVLNTGDMLAFEDVKTILDILHSQGLSSVILVGGGEPTLNRHFSDIVRYIKGLGIQVGISTNGSRMNKIIEVSDCLDEKDWIRLSLDAGTNESFQRIHRPKTKISLKGICESVREIVDINAGVWIWFSFIATWEGCRVNGKALLDNIDEIPDAVQLAKESGFSHFSLKPCLVRLKDSRQESLLFGITEEQIARIVNRIKRKTLEARKIAGDKIKIVESTNLLAMFNSELDKLNRQTKTCHLQFFRQVVTPIGIYHCPSYRGQPKAWLADINGYTSENNFSQTREATEKMLVRFNASEECDNIVCIYNSTNRWMEGLIESETDVDSLEIVDGENFFF